MPGIRQQPSSDPPFLLVSFSSPAADEPLVSEMLGLYRKTEEMIEGCSVYNQENDKEVEGKLFRSHGVWVLKNKAGAVNIRVAKPSESPTSALWQYDFVYKTWQNDPAFKVNSLSEKPIACVVAISLSKEVKRDIKEPGVEGLYMGDGSYYMGRPVLQHEGGHYTLSVEWAGSGGVGRSRWRVTSGSSDLHLHGGSVPIMCPAEHRAVRDEMRGVAHWEYKNKKGRWTESWGICLQCKKQKHL